MPPVPIATGNKRSTRKERKEAMNHVYHHTENSCMESAAEAMMPKIMRTIAPTRKIRNMGLLWCWDEGGSCRGEVGGSGIGRVCRTGSRTTGELVEQGSGSTNIGRAGEIPRNAKGIGGSRPGGSCRVATKSGDVELADG